MMMKESGIEWIGKIPSGWGVRKIKHLSNLSGRIGWQGLTSNEYQDEGPYLITGTDFKNGQIAWEKCVHITPKRYDEASQIQIKNGDLLITKDGTIGKVAIVQVLEGDASLNSGVLLIRPKFDDKYIVKYCYYILCSDIFWKWYESNDTGNSTIKHLYQEKFKEFSYPLPSLPTQHAIAAFLDRKCSLIDDTIQKQRLIIDKLKEYRQAVITEAVTKGITPGVAMKESGVEWIGVIPEEWNVAKIKLIADTYSGSTPLRDKTSKYFENAMIKWIRTLDLNDFEVYDSSEKITQIAQSESSCPLLPAGTIMVAMYGGSGTIGKCGLLMNEATTNQAICSLVMKKHIIPKYVLYLLLSMKKYWMKYAVGTRKDPNISQEIVANMRICIPPQSEQIEITTQLDTRCTAIDTTIQKKELIINRLIEYKKSIIYEVVTGKKEI